MKLNKNGAKKLEEERLKYPGKWCRITKMANDSAKGRPFASAGVLRTISHEKVHIGHRIHAASATPSGRTKQGRRQFLPTRNGAVRVRPRLRRGFRWDESPSLRGRPVRRQNVAAGAFALPIASQKICIPVFHAAASDFPLYGG